MRRLIVALTVAIGALAFGATPAPAHTLADDNGSSTQWHHNCSGGLKLYVGGGSGYQAMIHKAADLWNEHAKANSRFPKITSRVPGDHNGLVWGYNAGASPEPCIIDTDEVWELQNDWAGIGGLSDRNRHVRSGWLLMAGKHYNGGAYNQRSVDHELGHAFGLGHTNPHTDQQCSLMWSGIGPSGCIERWFTDDNWRAMNTLYNH